MCLTHAFQYEHLMVETILSQILLLLQPPFKPIYYTLVIMDLFKLQFSVHLATGRMGLCLGPSKIGTTKERHGHEVLERESIESAPSLEELLPSKCTTNFICNAEDGDQTGHGLSLKPSDMVKEQLTSQEIISWVDDHVLPAHGLDVTLRLVVQTLLNIRSKHFFHLIAVLERYGQGIEWICSDQVKQVMLIFEVSFFWKNNDRMTAVAIDRMMGYRVISTVAIMRWIFSSSDVNQFHVPDHPWEVQSEH